METPRNAFEVGADQYAQQRSPRKESLDDESLDDDDDWKIADEMKESVEKSTWLRDQLQDGGLRQIIIQVVNSRSTEALHQAQQRFPHFQQFSDKMLLVAGILKYDEEAGGEAIGGIGSLKELLELDWNENGTPHLSLKPRQRKVPVFRPVDVSSSEESSSSSSVDGSDSASSEDDEDSNE